MPPVLFGWICSSQELALRAVSRLCLIAKGPEDWAVCLHLSAGGGSREGLSQME